MKVLLGLACAVSHWRRVKIWQRTINGSCTLQSGGRGGHHQLLVEKTWQGGARHG
jgi:hypothetical protein